MNVDKLNLLARHFGIHPNYNDFDGNLVNTSIETQIALLKANGLALDNEAMIDEAIAFYVAVEEDRWFPHELVTGAGYGYECNFGLGAKWHIELDDQLSEDVRSQVHPDSLSGVADTHISLPALPAGIHDLICEVGGRCEIVTIICAPHRAPAIESLTGKSHIWGLNAPLYGLRSERNSGLGDYEDLARLAEYTLSLGGSYVGINPVHTLGFNDLDAMSPYSPSHRGFYNTQHIAADFVPGLDQIPEARALFQTVEAQWDELRRSESVRYRDHRICHNAALRDLHTLFNAHASTESKMCFQTHRQASGDYLERFALFEALSELYGQDWRRWPAAVRDRDATALDQHRTRLAARIDFHAWLQWVAETQLADAQRRASADGRSMGLYLDLAVGARHGGAESWCEADSVAMGVSLGAPPDQLGPDGQNWGLMTYAPKKLALNKYRSLRKIYQSAMRHAGILRIDHVLGLNRSFWIPEDGSPGAYVSQPMDVFLAILSIEANASGTSIIGEDLGLVPEGFREKVQARGVYGYSVLQYEKWPDGAFKHPDDLRQYSLACFSTHDTPTLKGYLSGSDIVWRDRLSGDGSRHSHEAKESRRRDVSALAAMNGEDGSMDDSFDHLFDVVHGKLAASKVAMISVQMDDVLGQEEAQNLPGTIDEHPNWRRKYALSLTDLDTAPGFQKISDMMERNGRNIDPPSGLENPDEQSIH
ncbi:4-alpha-glucanotransferase [Cohaesibacter sp. CAU 1516]|uniref:4-alpha-glucanotransferase n=1 Tax=Cohaesibacter sp. CAU 1516 TaxID=2576038 RepID=UPI0010FDD757|nr:4-alpha-glucanotransferase [Cohaesibacter sp. CAU 1516]TLP49309.1 4-alpha-glucanotransferase [Cohaesibacter sp. CAU 1516]